MANIAQMVNVLQSVILTEGDKMLLYINACCRTDSRTARLAKRLISRLNDSVSEVRTGELHFPVMDEAFLNRRDSAVAAQDFSDPLFALGKEFSA